MDKGPWRTYLNIDRKQYTVGSDDFRRDVSLQVTGDFADDAERLAYCEWLAGVLNAATDPPDKSLSQRLADAGFTRRDTRSQCDNCGEMVGRQFLPIHECNAESETAARSPITAFGCSKHGRVWGSVSDPSNPCPDCDSNNETEV